MPRLVCRLVARDGAAPFPCTVLDPDGWPLRLSLEPPAAGLPPLGRVGGSTIWAEQVGDRADLLPAAGEELVIESDGELDEVGVAVGPDRGSGDGLFDPADRSATGERTGSAGEEAARDQQRTAALTWIAASVHAVPTDLPDTLPCASLRKLIADEPLDPLLALDGVELPPVAVDPADPRPGGVVPAEDEDTATVVAVQRPLRRAFSAPSNDETRPGPTASRPPPPAPERVATPRAQGNRWVAWVLVLLVGAVVVGILWAHG